MQVVESKNSNGTRDEGSVPKSLDDLLVKVRSGDEESIGPLYHGIRDYVYSRIYLLGDFYSYRLAPIELDEVAELAIAKAWDNLGSFRQGSKLTSWLYRIAKNSLLDGMRKQKPRVSFDAITDQDLDEDIDPRDRVEAASAAAAIYDLIQELPARQQKIITEYAGEGTLREAAARLGEPESTVKSRMYRARDHLVQEAQEVLGSNWPDKYDLRLLCRELAVRLQPST